MGVCGNGGVCKLFARPVGLQFVVIAVLVVASTIVVFVVVAYVVVVFVVVGLVIVVAVLVVVSGSAFITLRGCASFAAISTDMHGNKHIDIEPLPLHSSLSLSLSPLTSLLICFYLYMCL